MPARASSPRSRRSANRPTRNGAIAAVALDLDRALAATPKTPSVRRGRRRPSRARGTRRARRWDAQGHRDETATAERETVLRRRTRRPAQPRARGGAPRRPPPEPAPQRVRRTRAIASSVSHPLWRTRARRSGRRDRRQPGANINTPANRNRRAISAKFRLEDSQIVTKITFKCHINSKLSQIETVILVPWKR